MFKIVSFNTKQLCRDSLYRIVLPLAAVVILLASFIIIKSLQKDPIAVSGEEEAYFVLPHECCLTYDVFASNSEIEATAGNILRWGLTWVNKGNEPQADPGSDVLLGKYGALYRADKSKKVIYLTFDMGYEAGYTTQLLDVLKANNIKAVFFLLSNYVTRNPELVQRMIDEGHYIGNHTATHKCLPLLSSEELVSEMSSFNSLLKANFGITSNFFRAPKGEYNELVLKTAKNMNMTTLFWSFGYKDWDKDNSKGSDYAVEYITSKLHNGMILLLHNVNGDNAGAMSQVISIAEDKGYTFGDPTDLRYDKKVSEPN